ncbi:LAFE_0C09934g1_1 [Lachancea fermentati]|uniref:COX assembly mitochondrial protein n=1 Tax=Lachancea fermentati TaxID=4955 RepID=A0A1G4MA12_LACFM|nr:LAFE_0C09934g1_1 [Lachancea fermentati]
MSQEDPATKHSRKLPIWVLGPREEKAARSNLKTFAYSQCAEYVQAMAECSKLHGLKVFPACDKQRDKMGECILFYQTDPKYLDEERDKIVQEKLGKLEKQLKDQKRQQDGHR